MRRQEAEMELSTQYGRAEPTMYQLRVETANPCARMYEGFMHCLRDSTRAHCLLFCQVLP